MNRSGPKVRGENERALMTASRPTGRSSSTGSSPSGGPSAIDEFVARVRRLVARKHRPLFDQLVESPRFTLRPLLAFATVQSVEMAEAVNGEKEEKRKQWLTAKMSDHYDQIRKLAKAENSLNPGPTGGRFSVSVRGVSDGQMTLDLDQAVDAGLVYDADHPLPDSPVDVEGAETEAYRRDQNDPIGTGGEVDE